MTLSNENWIPYFQRTNKKLCSECHHAYTRKYSQENSQRLKDYANKYRNEDREEYNRKSRISNKKWRSKPENMEKMKKSVKIWRGNNPEKVMIYSKRAKEKKGKENE